MMTICSICKGVVRQCEEPPSLATDGSELVSHGAHPACMLEYYGEDFADILGGQPT